jgi:hypothetical protein
MKTCLRVLVLLLLVICCSAPWLGRWHSPHESWIVTNTQSPEPPPATTRSAEFEQLFAPVPDAVWSDRETVLADDSVREIVERMQVAGLSPDELRRERARLGEWLETHRAETVVDLPGAWHGLLRLVDSEVDEEYEANRRKRKLLGQLLASVDD